MAKALKPKKYKEVIVEPVVIKETVSEATDYTWEKSPEIEIAEDKEPTVVEYVEERQPDILKEESAERIADDSMEASILKYLDSKGEGEHLLNDFIKSLFPIPKINEPAIYLTQENSRYIRHVLDNMQLESKISIVNNSHRKLGAHWYEEGTGIAKKHNLLTVKIVAKK